MSRLGLGGTNPNDAGKVTPLPDGERQLERAELGEIEIGSDAARKIAADIEAQGGFWGPRISG